MSEGTVDSSDGDDNGDDHDGRDVRDVTIFLVVVVVVVVIVPRRVSRQSLPTVNKLPDIHFLGGREEGWAR